jgi:hypothetical protein
VPPSLPALTISVFLSRPSHKNFLSDTNHHCY